MVPNHPLSFFRAHAHTRASWERVSRLGMLQSPRPSDLGSEADEVHAGLQPSTIIYQGKKGYKMVRQYLMGDMLGEGAQGKVKEAGALSHLSLGRCSALP